MKFPSVQVCWKVIISRFNTWIFSARLSVPKPNEVSDDSKVPPQYESLGQWKCQVKMDNVLAIGEEMNNIECMG